MVTIDRPHSRRARVAILVLFAFVAGGLALSSPSGAAPVTSVIGEADGYQLNVSLFGGPVNTRGVGQVACTAPNTPVGCAPAPAASQSPSVTLPPTGSASPITATQAGTQASVGPATFFTSGTLDVSTVGTIGPSGSVTSTTNIANITNTNGEVFSADNVSSTCTASGTGVTASTTITNGVLQTDSGDTNPPAHPRTTVPVLTNPAPNTEISGHIHVNGAQDNFRYRFNEQIINPDGSITVYAAHQVLDGPTAVGDLFIGKAVCGVLPAPTTTTTAASTTVPATTTTVPATTTTMATTTTLPATTTTVAITTTTTTRPATTTTTRPATTTTTRPATTTTTRPATTTTTTIASTTTTVAKTTTTVARTTTTVVTTTTTTTVPATTTTVPRTTTTTTVTNGQLCRLLLFLRTLPLPRPILTIINQLIAILGCRRV